MDYERLVWTFLLLNISGNSRPSIQRLLNLKYCYNTERVMPSKSRPGLQFSQMQAEPNFKINDANFTLNYYWTLYININNFKNGNITKFEKEFVFIPEIRYSDASQVHSSMTETSFILVENGFKGMRSQFLEALRLNWMVNNALTPAVGSTLWCKTNMLQTVSKIIFGFAYSSNLIPLQCAHESPGTKVSYIISKGIPHYLPSTMWQYKCIVQHYNQIW